MNYLKNMKIKIFADGANLDSIKELNLNDNISGFTTNPSLMKKAGVKDYKSFSLDVLKIIGTKPVSFEIFSDELDEMYSQASEIASWGNNVYVKIPITNSQGEKTSELVKKLLRKGIKCNVTAISTFEQVKEIYDISQNDTEVIISIFAGRIADTGIDPNKIMADSVNLCKSKDKIKILWASVREPYNYLQAKQLGCHIITIPPTTIQKIEKFGKSFNQLTKETVRTFLTDAISAGFEIKINK